MSPRLLATTEPAVIVRRDPDEDPDARPRPGEPIHHQAGVLHRLPRDFEEEPLLRVHRRRLARRDPEEVGVEEVDAVDEAAVVIVDSNRAGIIARRRGQRPFGNVLCVASTPSDE